MSLNQTISRLLFIGVVIMTFLSFSQMASASSFGAGYFGANVPFGTATNIAMSITGSVSLNLVPTGPNFSGTSSSTITVTSDDVNGYYLYTYCPGNNALVDGSLSIPASTNVSPATLANNSWGYNTDGSTNFVGFKTTPVVITTANGPYISGNSTTVTYGVITDYSTPEGSYSAPVTYTVAAMDD